MFDIRKASQELEDLDLKFRLGSADIEVQWFRVMQTDPGWHIYRHVHSFYEFHFMYSGTCRVQLDTGRFTAGPGEFYVCAPGVYHDQSGSGNEGIVEYCLSCSISPGAVFGMADRRDAGVKKSGGREDASETDVVLGILRDSPCRAYAGADAVMKLFESALEEAYCKNVGYFSQIVGITSRIILTAARLMAGQKDVGYAVPLKSANGDSRFYQLNKFIEDNISQPVDVGQLSDFMHLSTRQVSRIIACNTGLSAKEFIIREKVGKAVEMLNSTDLAIREISARLGFSSEYYFSQFFKRMMGVSPSSLRKKGGATV